MVLGGVTRFGEFSPFWQNYKNWQFLQVLGTVMNLWQFLEGLFSIWKNLEPRYYGNYFKTLGKFILL